ncbi:hypothetical protein [Sinomicrobium sp.]
MSSDCTLIADLLEKFKNNTISRKEYEQLVAAISNPLNEGEVKYIMEEYWRDLDMLNEEEE